MFESRLLKVFYGADNLPYKDKERTIHFPITGSSFAGSHNTNTIRFYVRDIGGLDNVSWVLVSKLPNGKLGYDLLSDTGYDSDVGEYYIDFDVSSYYTQVKGVLKLALRGYQGQITFEEDSDGIYEIYGNPMINVTGTIDFAINYAPLGQTGNEMLPSDVDRILAALSGYLTYGQGIVVLENESADISGYNQNQLFLIRTYSGFQLFYKGVDGLVSLTTLILGNNDIGKAIIEYDSSEDEISIYNDNGNGINISDDGLKVNGGVYSNGDRLATEDDMNTRLQYLNVASTMTIGNLASGMKTPFAIVTLNNTKYDTYAIHLYKSGSYYYELLIEHLFSDTRYYVEYASQNDTIASVMVSANQVDYAQLSFTKGFAKTLQASIDNTTYVMTLVLKDYNGNALSTQTIDLPLESVVVSGSYDSATQSIILTLQSGSTITIPVGDLVSGLVSTDDLALELLNYVPKTTTIAGVDLQDNITAQELTDALVLTNTTTDVDYILGD